MSIQLKEVVDVLLKVDDDTNVWYDRKADRLKWHSPYSDDIDDEGAQVDPVHCVNLPSRYEINDYRLMELFIERLPEGEAKKHLSASIIGRGAFRRFRGTAERFDLLQDWYDFREACYVSFARKWCEINKVPYEPYVKPVMEFKEADFDLYDDEAFHMMLADSGDKEKEQEEKKPSFTIAEVPEENKALIAPLAENADELSGEHRHVLAVSDEGSYAGFAVVDDTDEPTVTDLFVSRKYRRKGMGSALLQKAQDTYGPVHVHVDHPDFQAKSFLKACGYHIVSMDYTK